MAIGRSFQESLQKALRGLETGLDGLAEMLPLPDRSVDVVSIAFGLRNCTDKQAVLGEAFEELDRVLLGGGKAKPNKRPASSGTSIAPNTFGFWSTTAAKRPSARRAASSARSVVPSAATAISSTSSSMPRA